MALRKALAHRLSATAKASSAPAASLKRLQTPPQPPALSSSEETGDGGFFRRWLQKGGIFSSAARPECLAIPTGDGLVERLRGLNGDRLRWDGLTPPASVSAAQTLFPPPARLDDGAISARDVHKLLRISQLEVVKSSLRGVPKSCVSRAEFLQIVSSCVRGPDSSAASVAEADADEIAKMLDDSGVVLVLGNVVFLHPEQIVKTIESAIPVSLVHPNDPRRKELERMEEEKREIDERAAALARRELWCGLGLLIAQTVGFMRLTFWELSWDVMEPICFYVTSMYFMAGYAFFMRTSKEPSFEGFFQSRFFAKQKCLIKARNFDIQRFNELRSTFHLPSTTPPHSNAPDRGLLGALQ